MKTVIQWTLIEDQLGFTTVINIDYITTTSKSNIIKAHDNQCTMIFAFHTDNTSEKILHDAIIPGLSCHLLWSRSSEAILKAESVCKDGLPCTNASPHTVALQLDLLSSSFCFISIPIIFTQMLTTRQIDTINDYSLFQLWPVGVLWISIL